VLSCVGRGLYEELITFPKESYHVPNKIIKISERRPWLYPGWSAIGIKKIAFCIKVKLQ
jgi:hypothetical protein